MKKQRKFAGHPAIISATSEDRISDLPDDVLHLILRRMNSPTQAGKTMALSRRWRSLWRSYPVLEFDEADCHSRRGWKICPAAAVATDYLHKFTAASIERFSGNQLPIEAFKVSLAREDVRIKRRRAVILEQLLSLALERERKPGEITMDITGYRLPCRKGILTSGLKILRLTGIKFGSDWRCDDLPPLNSLRLLRLKYVKFNHENLLANLIARAPFLETLEYRGSAAGSTKLQVISKLPTNLNSLRFLCLENVAIENNDQLFTNLISSSPLLETLELREISKLRKLRVISRLNNLKTIKIGYPLDAERIEIDAPGLETLHLQPLYHEVMEIKVTAPELRHLELGGSGFTERNVCELLSNLCGGSSLKSLTLLGLDRVEKLNFLSPELEEFKLFMWANSKLREIQLDAGPRLAKFFVGCRNVLPDGKLEKCGISSDATACRLEVDFGHVRFDSSRLFGGLRRVIAGFSQLHTARGAIGKESSRRNNIRYID
ncbi:unnamed protein product [Linum trigynum]|uniref:F-box domain-containing protein n=1 Tax=Linum trigynum TaxID=586398 RepID=A0AAV2F5Q5_9ROSI